MTSWDYMVVPDYLRMEPRSKDTMFDDRQTKEEIIAAASRQNQMLIEALCDVQRRDAEIEQLQSKLSALTDMLEKIANHPDTPKLLASYARGELHPINPLTGQNNNKKPAEPL